MYHVSKDYNDTVARKPLDKNDELKQLLEEIPLSSKERNIKRYLKKEKMEHSFIRLKWLGFKKRLKKLVLGEYIHDVQYVKE